MFQMKRVCQHLVYSKLLKGNIYGDKLKTYGVHLLYFLFDTFYVTQACKILLFCKRTFHLKVLSETNLLRFNLSNLE